MSAIRLCKECGVPFSAKDLQWTTGGTIEQKVPPRERQVFCECEFIDPLFEGISDLLGLPIDHIVIESRRREVKAYVEARYPAVLRRSMKYISERMMGDSRLKKYARSLLGRASKAMFLRVAEIGRACGFGDIRPREDWDFDDRYAHHVHTVIDPYSLLLYLGETLGSAEAWDMEELRIEHERVGKKTYTITLSPGEHPIALADRLQRKDYGFKPGDISFEACPTCGLPRDLSAFHWNIDLGTIKHKSSGRRMAMFGSGSIEAVLDDLEAELGEEIPNATINSQRAFVKTNYDIASWKVSNAGDLKRELALRGLGNLTHFEAGKSGVELAIENSCLHLLMVGTARGFFELIYHLDNSSCEWELSADRTLHISLSA